MFLWLSISCSALSYTLMPFFDLHCHPSFKSALAHLNVADCPNPIVPVDVNGTGLFAVCLNAIAGNSLDSQSSFSQIPGGSLVVASFLALERSYTFISVLRHLTPLDNQILDTIQNQTGSYHAHLKDRDLQHFLNFLPQSTPTRRYQLINSMLDYPATPDANTVYVIGSIEGGHNFYDIADLVSQETPPNQSRIIDVLKNWKRDSASDPGHFPRLLYITLCHHAQNALANHAWAVPLTFDPGFLAVGSFDPTGNGLSDTGKEFVRTALRQEGNQKRILIDIKHLGIQARQDYYKLRDSEFADVPILATHMGVTGTSWERPPLFISPKPFAGNPACLEVQYGEIGGFVIRKDPPTGSQPSDQLTRIPFNPWSINLYNEDIVEVMRSQGLIGVSLDRRIIGAKLTTAFVDPERFSRHDIPQAWLGNPDKPFSLYPAPPLPDLPDILFRTSQITALQDQWTFAQQIVHIVLISELAKNENKLPAALNPWEHICLGSDYDGLINSIRTAETARTLDRLFNNRLQQFIEAMIKHLINNGVLSNAVTVPHNIIQKLSVENGLAFLRKHFV